MLALKAEAATKTMRTFALDTVSAKCYHTPRRHSIVAKAKQGTSGSSAIVIGGGICGLTASKALSKHFNQVALLERDTYNDVLDADALSCLKRGSGSRKGVPQYEHFHGLLSMGASVMDEVFPGYLDTLRSEGAVFGNWLTHCKIIHANHGPIDDVDLPGENVPIVMATRHLLERTARRFVQATPNIMLQGGSQVVGLVADSADPCSIRGVRLADGSVREADLVVDASGRSARSLTWLQELQERVPGASYMPPISNVNANVGYLSRLYRLDPEVERKLGYSFFYCMAQHPRRAVFACSRVEGGLWMLLFGGFEGSYVPPADDQAILQAARDMWSPVVYHIVQGATPVSPGARWTGLDNTWRRYDRVSLPENLVIMGDAICSFNPTYGQGITVSALQARLLGQLLAQRSHQTAPAGLHLRGLSNQFQAQAAPIIKSAWSLAAMQDSAWPGATSSPDMQLDILSKVQLQVMDEIQGLATYDHAIGLAFQKVFHMIQPADSLLTPEILGKVAVRVAAKGLAQAGIKLPGAMPPPEAQRMGQLQALV